MELRGNKMSECYNEKFIRNNEVIMSSDFEDEILHRGKSLYEVIRIIEGTPLFLEDHLDRLYRSANITNLEIWLKKEEIKESIKKLSKINNQKNGNVKIVFNYDGEEKTYLCYFIKHKYPSQEMYEKGVRTSLYNAERENPNAKVINSNLREATNKIMKETGVYEIILVNREAYITEGSRSNIFMVKDNNIYTSPVKDVLPGITRKYIIKACRNLGYDVIEERINSKDVNTLQGMFVSGTSPKILPISQVDNIKFDPNNEIIRALMKEYDKIIENYIKNN